MESATPHYMPFRGSSTSAARYLLLHCPARLVVSRWRSCPEVDELQARMHAYIARRVLSITGKRKVELI